MKKLLLYASTLLLSFSIANAQGVTTTSAYDDFNVTPYTGTDALGIYWWQGTRTAGQLSIAVPASVTYVGVDFGTNTVPNPDEKHNLNLSTMADIEVDIENTNATQHLSVRVVLEDGDGTQTQIEPNVSDAALVANETTPLSDGTAWPAGQNGGDPAVYPRPAYNGFILPANTRRTIRLDLSSVPGNIGGRIAGSYTAGTPSTMPASTPGESNGFDASNVHAVLFIINESTNFTFSNGATDKGSYRFDSTAAAGQSNYSGTIILRSFKMGSVLTALGNVTGVNEALIDNSLNVYPNPADDALTVSFTAEDGVDVSLTDIIGNKVYSTTTTNAGENKISVNTSALSSGIYILNIVTENGTVARKVTIK